MAASALQVEKEAIWLELPSWGIVVIIPHEVAFIWERGQIRELALRPDQELPIQASSQE
jgi:hypothetical protein